MGNQKVESPRLTGNVHHRNLYHKCKQPQQQTLVIHKGDKFKLAPMKEEKGVVTISKGDGYRGICTFAKTACVGIFMLQGDKMSAYHAPGGINEHAVKVFSEGIDGADANQEPKYVWIDFGGNQGPKNGYDFKRKVQEAKKHLSEYLGVNVQNIFVSSGNITGQ